MDRQLILLLSGLLLLIMAPACQSQPDSLQELCFFVAGHAYGVPESDHSPGMWDPLHEFLRSENEVKNMDFGVFTGDFVVSGSHENLRAFEMDRQALPLPTYVVPGNHDLLWNTFHEPYDSLYAEKPFVRYHAEWRDSTLLLFLDPNICNWSICREQLEWLRVQIQSAGDAREILIFVHQLIWWEKQENSPWHTSTPNSLFSRADSTNFQSEILPLLESVQKPVFIFAGDYGAKCQEPEGIWMKAGNLNFIAAGMGCPDRNYLLQVQRSTDGGWKMNLSGIGSSSGKSLSLTPKSI